MRVALFLPSLQGGGAEKVNLLLAQGLSERGLQVDLVLASAHGPHLESVPSGIGLVNLNAPRVLVALPSLAAYLKRHRPAVLLSSLTHANIISVWARQIVCANTRVVVAEHSVLGQSSAQRLPLNARASLWLLPWVYRNADAVVAVSQGVAEELIRDFRVPKAKVKIIYNPVIHSDFFKLAEEPISHPWFQPGGTPVFLAVGRLVKEKDFASLIRAFANVRRMLDSRLLILGEGPERPHLEGLVRELGLDAHVSMPGFVPNPYPYMARAAALVLSSLWEALPTVLIEALALGTPVIATDCPYGPAEILEGGKWGKLVPVGDVSRLAQTMLAVVREPPTEGERNSWRVYALSKFSLAKSSSGYLELIYDVVRYEGKR